MAPAKVLIKLIMPGLGLGRMERFYHVIVNAWLGKLDKYSSNCILMTPAKVLIKLIVPGLGLGRIERF